MSIVFLITFSKKGKKIERIDYFHTLYLTFHIKFLNSTNLNLTFSFMSINKQQNKHNKPYPQCNPTAYSLILDIYDYSNNKRNWHKHHSFSICLTHSILIVFLSFIRWFHIITRQEFRSFSFWFIKPHSKQKHNHCHHKVNNNIENIIQFLLSANHSYLFEFSTLLFSFDQT